MKMNNLLKISLLLIFSVLFLTANAQKYSVEAGFVQPKQFGTGFSKSYFNGGKIGANVEFELKNNFSLLTGALYSMVYGSKTQYYSSTDSVNYKTFGHSINIPLHINYSLPASKNFKFFAYAGPTIGVGLAQPQRVTAIMSDAMKTFTGINSISYANNDLYNKSVIQRINLQMSIGGGIQFKNYKLKSGYDFGINSINKIDSSKILRQSGWYVSLVYQF
jgi:hypothetical protein